MWVFFFHWECVQKLASELKIQCEIKNQKKKKKWWVVCVVFYFLIVISFCCMVRNLDVAFEFLVVVILLKRQWPYGY